MAKDLTWRAPTALMQVEAAVAAGIHAAAERVLQVSDEHIPADPDRKLEESGKVTGYGLTAAVSYDTEYAVVQHERTDFHHDAGQTAKFLQQAGVSEASALPAIVAASVRALTGRA